MAEQINTYIYQSFTRNIIIMKSSWLTIMIRLTVLIILFCAIESKGQTEFVLADYIYKFNSETARYYDNALVSDGSFLYDIKYDGGLNGGGSIFKIKPDGSEYSTLFNFIDNSTGLNPVGTLVLSGTTLYGMAIFGGNNNMGVVFRIETNGTGFQKLLNFNFNNGALPYCSLIISGSTLYGLSQQGGTSGYGLVFKLQTDGTGYQTLLNFTGENGWGPTGSLVLSGSILYGVTARGGAHDLGVVFAVNTNGTGYQKLVDFEQNTGSAPFGSLTLSGSTLYGTTIQGGPQSAGTLYKVETNGTNFEVIHDFGSGGFNPQGKLLLNDSKIFGMTGNGGNADGLIYSIDMSGDNFTILHAFNKTDGRNPWGSLTIVNGKLYAHVPGGTYDYGVIININQDGTEFQQIKNFEATNKGYQPRGGLALTPASGFGVTYQGGKYNKGVIYKVDNTGTGYTVLHNFNATDGAFPASSLILSGKSLYGVTTMGGSEGLGVLFSMDTTGLNYEVLIDFTGINGSYPVGSLIDDGVNTLYGMTGANSSNNKGTIFKLDKSTKILTTLYSFEDTDASKPYGSITLSGSKLYGMSLGGVGDGVVFSLNTDGTEFTKILDKNSIEAGRYPNSLTVSGTTIYGTMTQGGTHDWGTVFKIETNGTEFQKLVDFVYGIGDESNGAVPTGATLVLGDSIIYGITKLGGPNDSGITYSVNTDGTNFTVLFDFNFNRSNSPSGRVKSSGQQVTAEGSLAFKNGYFYTPLSLQAGDYRTGGIIKFAPNNTEVITALGDEPFNKSAIYPNPSSHFIRLPLNSNMTEVYLIDSSGNRMAAKITETNSIDVSQLSGGVYYIVAGLNRYRFIKR